VFEKQMERLKDKQSNAPDRLTRHTSTIKKETSQSQNRNQNKATIAWFIRWLKVVPKSPSSRPKC
jgi:hypothetical protein